jgi:hypothetical protein
MKGDTQMHVIDRDTGLPIFPRGDDGELLRNRPRIGVGHSQSLIVDKEGNIVHVPVRKENSGRRESMLD